MNPSVAAFRRLLRSVLLISFALFFMFLFFQTPTHDGEWSRLQTRLPLVTLQQNSPSPIYHIENLRDFRYHADGSVQSANYRSAEFSPAHLQQIWLGISHFGNYGFAHTFLSFEFSDDKFLAVSVEARLRPTQTYNPLLGLLRQYNKMVVLGTEADIIGLRTHIRKERVLLYPLQLNAQQRDYLFHAVMSDAQQIVGQPEFYNTLLDNCATNLIKHDPNYRFYTSLLDYRLLLPGYADEVMQEKGWVQADQPIVELRKRAVIDAELMSLDATDFSRVIRQQWLR